MWDPVNAACEVCECSSKESEPFHHDGYLEKENVRQTLGSPMKLESDLSLYGSSSPDRPTCGIISPNRCSRQIRVLEDHDQNSQDSGYGAGYPGDRSNFFQFARSLGVTPRQYLPKKECSLSFGSMDSMDDEFLEFADLEQPIDENAQLPSDFNTLINGPFTSTMSTREISPEFDYSHRPPFRRAISFDVAGQTPNSSRVRSCLFKKDDVDFRSFKRPEPPIESKSPVQNKRSKVDEEVFSVPELAAVPARPLFRRSVSASEESIKYALQRSFTEPDLIGDFTAVFCLPLTSGRHQDLKSITPATLASVIKGEYQDTITSYKVIDCRYPYEYNGGHIDDAKNLYTKEQILEHLLNTQLLPVANSENMRRNILVFHCEFSSERGPNLYRFLRKWDRLRNTDVYPALHYPEIYLLDGGYKNFFEHYPELCAPESYLPMLDPNYSNDLRHFRAKSRTWNADQFRLNSRGLKRLGFP